MKEIHETNKNEVAWTSWLPALGYALAKSTGPVLEIGMGHFSTPFLHEFCKGADRHLTSIEDNADWYYQLVDKFSGGNHSTYLATSYEAAFKELTGNRIGVVFIDNSPGGEARSEPFRRLLPHCDYIVVHDYHRENEEAIKPLLQGVNHKVYADYDPPTLLASLIHPL